MADRIVYQYDFADNDPDASDYAGHGSHVSSVIASQDGTYRGLAPAADLIHLKVFSDDGRGYFSYLERALQWVVDNAGTYNVATVNLSLGDGNNWSQSVGLFGVADELAALDAMGVIVVSAAGNGYAVHGGQEGLAYPAADPYSLAVGAVWDSDRGGPHEFGQWGIDYTTGPDRIAAFSQRHGQRSDVFAPGALITGANAWGGVTAMRGTSMAAPHVAGAAVLVQQLAAEQLGRPLSTSDFRRLVQLSGAVIHGGDDEDDNVPNTGENFLRLDVYALAQAVPGFRPGDPPAGADGTQDTAAHSPPNSQDFGDGSFGTGESFSLDVVLDTTLLGGANAWDVTFESNDPLRPATAVSITVDVADYLLIDNGDPGFRVLPGSSFLYAGNKTQYVDADVHYKSKGTGDHVLEWAFSDLAVGVYDVSATWFAHSNRAT